jgi:hydrogenase/urease accessory protein HupE
MRPFAPLPCRSREARALANGRRCGVAVPMLIAFAGVLSTARPAGAHAIGLSRGEYHAEEGGVSVALTFARGDVISVVPALEGAPLDAARLQAARKEVARGTVEKIRIASGGTPCEGALTDVRLTEQDGLELRAHYACPAGTANFDVTLPLLDDLAFGHRHAAHVLSGATTADHLLSRRAPDFTVARREERGASPSPAHGGGFLRMGIEHILTGYDHLLFLFALVLVGATVRSLALAITAFTVAHSLTLGLAVLGYVAPPARLIEPAIALSVAYVGIENFFARPEARWKITFPFGLLHGFGFAGALGEIEVPRSDVPWALLSFNLGVEIGQLAWMAVLALAVSKLRRFDWFGRRAVPLLSWAIVAIGVIWFVGRVQEPAVAAARVRITATRHG